MEYQKILDKFARAFVQAWAADIANPDPQWVATKSYDIAEAMVEERERRLGKTSWQPNETYQRLDLFAEAFMRSWVADIENPNPQRVAQTSYNIAQAMLEESGNRLEKIATLKRICSACDKGAEGPFAQFGELKKLTACPECQSSDLAQTIDIYVKEELYKSLDLTD